jgi:AraC-like DNA-binding protein
MEISFRTFSVLPQLKPYIHKIWVFESDRPMPDNDMKLVVPDGKILLVLPFRNILLGKMNGKINIGKTDKIGIVGMSDYSAIVDAGFDAPVGTIGVEINPAGAYRFFRINLNSITHQLYDLTDILPKSAKQLEEQLSENVTVEGKIYKLQHYLLSLYQLSEPDKIFDYCIGQIERTYGMIRVKELEVRTGYSSRWLNRKFENLLGLNPKTLNSILRFQKSYHSMLADPVTFFNRKDFYDYYHDESHFSKNFKRYTGYSPKKIIELKNDFGKTFYAD